MTTNDNKSVEIIDNLTKMASEMTPLGVRAQPPIAATPNYRASVKRPPSTPGAKPLGKREHEKIAQLVAYQGKTFAEAYAIVYQTEGVTESRANASRLKRTHPEIIKRVEFLDREVKEEAMLHKGTTFAETVNGLNDIFKAMYNRRSDPKAATVAISAAGLLLKATGNDESRTVEESQSIEQKQEIVPGIMATLKKVVTTKKEE